MLSQFATTPGLPEGFRDLLLKRTVDYAPSLPLDAVEAIGFRSSRIADFLPWQYAQETLTTCSVATVAVIANSILGSRGARWNAATVLDAEYSGEWACCTQDLAAGGLTLSQLDVHLSGVLSNSGIEIMQKQLLFVRPLEVPTVQRLSAALAAFEADRQCFMIANFNQNAFLRDGFDVGHFSVVGGYDVAANHVAVFDVDIRGLRPYWVPFDRFLQGIGTFDHAAGEHRGVLSFKAILK